MHMHYPPFQGNTHHEANTGHHTDEVDEFRVIEHPIFPGYSHPDHQTAHLDEVRDQEVDDIDWGHMFVLHLQLKV